MPEFPALWSAMVTGKNSCSPTRKTEGTSWSTRRREYDEDDVRVRPSRSSRPRTRTRPRHDEAGRRLRDRGRPGPLHLRPPEAGPDVRSSPRCAPRELGRKSVVVGDRVGLVGDTTGPPGTLARIVRIAERTSVLRRTADDDDTTAEGRPERVVVANADQLVIVSALADPPPRTGFIDRCLVAAYDADIEPLLCLTKSDLAGPEDVARLLRRAGAAVRAVPAGPAPGPICARCSPAGCRSWSVTPGWASRRWSTASSRRRTGRSARSARSAGAGTPRPARWRCACRPTRGAAAPGWIVDTPGVRSFGLAHVSAESLLHGFPDLVEATVDCPANCPHTADEAELRAGRLGGGRQAPTRAGSPRTAGCSPPVAGRGGQYPREPDPTPRRRRSPAP